jgi:hypothetical protein
VVQQAINPEILQRLAATQQNKAIQQKLVATAQKTKFLTRQLFIK